MAPLLTFLIGAAQIAPQLLRWIGADNAAEVAEKASGIAQGITGEQTPELALERLRADTRLAEQFQSHAKDLHLAELEAETRRLEAINATMRAEYASQDPY